MIVPAWNYKKNRIKIAYYSQEKKEENARNVQWRPTDLSCLLAGGHPNEQWKNVTVSSWLGTGVCADSLRC